MNELTATICALATPPGLGSIAVVRLSGPECYPIAARVFFPADPRKQVENCKGYTAAFGHYRLEGRTMDETVALFYRAPRSYTGEDVIELCVHGGSAMAEGLLSALISAGAVPAAAGEFTRRALENGRMSLTQAEAVMDVIGASGRQGAALAASALDGTLAKQIGEIRADLMTQSTHIAAWMDYPDEGIADVDEGALRAALVAARDRLDTLVKHYDAGAVLRHGVDAVLLGRPNVGKSTLLNLLAGFERAIVTPVAGTTRDVVEQAVMLGDTGIRLNLFDTAGLHDTEDVVEAEGIRRSWKKMDEAGLILAVFDGSAPADEQDIALAQKCAGRTAIAILNKNDQPLLFDEKAISPCFKRVLPFSALDAENRRLLADTVAQVLGTAGLDPGAAALSGQRQLGAATAARDALADALRTMDKGFGLDAVEVCLEDALSALARLTGEDVSESIIDEVFSRFCVGK